MSRGPNYRQVWLPAIHIAVRRGHGVHVTGPGFRCRRVDRGFVSAADGDDFAVERGQIASGRDRESEHHGQVFHLTLFQGSPCSSMEL